MIPPVAIPLPVPTLDEWGLIAMVAVMGVAGFFALRKRLRQAKQQ